MNMELRRAVGRLVTARGSSKPLNCTPLKAFHLDVALDASLIVALRAKRLTQDATLTDTLPMMTWAQRLALTELATLIETAAGGQSASIMEIGAGAGCLFEALKLRFKPDILRSYTAVGPPEESSRFSLLHASDTAPYDYADRLDLPTDPETIIVLNQNQAIRHGHMTNVDWSEIMYSLDAPAIAALRISLGDEETRLTVNGHIVRLEGLTALRQKLRSTAKPWRLRVISGFDEKFFLSGSGEASKDDAAHPPTTALCLAYLSPNLPPSNDFVAV